MTTWRKKITAKCIKNGETFGDIISCTLTDAELDVEFDCGWGGIEGKPFTAWSERFVYFPGCYDGREWCASVPRNPCSHATEHVGGG